MQPGKMSPERTTQLRVLANIMNKQAAHRLHVNQRMLDIFDVAITPEEANFLIRVGSREKSYEQLMAIAYLPRDKFDSFLEPILRKGLIWPKRDELGDNVYRLAPMMFGWFQVFLSDGKETPEQVVFARRLNEYFESLKRFNFSPVRNLMNYAYSRTSAPLQSIAAIRAYTDEELPIRTIDIGKTAEITPTRIYPAQSVYDIIENHNGGSIALMHCSCRQWHKMVGETCRFEMPHEACMALGSLAEPVVELDIGYYISKAQAFDIIEETETQGAVHTVYYEQSDITQARVAICNCCWDCCSVFGSYNRGITPLHVKAYYQAHIPDLSLCTGCGVCEEYCPINGISMTEESAVLDSVKCIGCGQCAYQCPVGAIELEYRERDVVLPRLKKSDARIQ